MKTSITLLAGVALCTGAMAQTYVEGGIGSSHISQNCEAVASCEHNTTGFKLILGYHVHPQVAIEASYVNWGQVNFDGPLDGRGDSTVTGYGLGAALSLPINPQWSVRGRLGVAGNHYDSSATLSGPVHIGVSKTKTAFQYGVAAQYELAKGFAVVGSYDGSQANDTSQNVDVNLFSIGVRYTF
jgi:outer membrane autotransporter protein